MQHGGQSRFKVHPAGGKGGKRHVRSGWRTFEGSIGGRSGPRLDHTMAKRTERHRVGPGNISILALRHPDLVKFCDLDPAGDAQGLAKTPR
jgi:hypothetical protein